MNEQKIGSILIVDDDRSNIDVLNHILKSVYVVYVAINGASAIKLAVKTKPDLILLDILMPDMTGYDVLKKIQCIEELTHTPVIFITGLSKIEEAEKGFLMGAVDYIVKPFSQTVVKSKINLHIQAAKNCRLLEQYAKIDPFTGLFNAYAFNEKLKQNQKLAFETNMALSVVTFAIDNIEPYAEKGSVFNANMLLKIAASAIFEAAELDGHYCARTGNEEFSVIMPGIDINEAENIAAKIKELIMNAVLACDWLSDKNVCLRVRIISEPVPELSHYTGGN